MKRRPPTVLLWFGVIGGPLAWACVHVAGYAFGLAQCDQPVSRWQLPVHAFDVAFSAVGIVIALLAELVALRIFRATRDEGNVPPIGRIHFLSVIGLTVNPLTMAIMVMTAIGTPLLHVCQQS